MTSIARLVFLAAAALLVVGLVYQVFLAGLGVFAGAANFATHRDTGYGLTALPVVMVVAGLLGRVGRRLIASSAVVFVLFILQSVLVLQRTSAPGIAALHPVNGFLMLLISLAIARDAWTMRRTETA